MKNLKNIKEPFKKLSLANEIGEQRLIYLVICHYARNLLENLGIWKLNDFEWKIMRSFKYISSLTKSLLAKILLLFGSKAKFLCQFFMLN